MVSDNDMSSEQESDMEEESGEHEHDSMGGMEASERDTGSSGQEMGAESESASTSKAKPKTSGRRAALRILRENVDNVSKDLTTFRKAHDANSKKLDKQVASLRNEVTSLKSFISKENARAKGKQEALLNRVITKLNEKKPKPAASAAKAKKKPAPKKSKPKK
jgi:hypothetical protein